MQRFNYKKVLILLISNLAPENFFSAKTPGLFSILNVGY